MLAFHSQTKFVIRSSDYFHILLRKVCLFVHQAQGHEREATPYHIMLNLVESGVCNMRKSRVPYQTRMINNFDPPMKT
jgi:hypothetical protein